LVKSVKANTISHARYPTNAQPGVVAWELMKLVKGQYAGFAELVKG
jgi:hypothetical protein